jgi:uncharacterized repeat protein (TIGR03803 family)
MRHHTKFTLAGVLLAGLAALAPTGGASAYTYKVLYDFCSKQSCVDGAAPQSSVTVDPDGTLVGTTPNGGREGGTAFRLSFAQPKDKWRYQRLYDFCKKPGCSDGLGPVAPLVIDAAGNLYGTAAGGGNGCGTLFELSPATRGQKPQYKVLYTFSPVNPCNGGGQPQGRLTYAGQSSGLLYDGTSPLFGTGTDSGTHNDGTVFMLTPGTPWTYTTLYNFCSQAQCADGAGALAGVTLDASGNIFGATEAGGTVGPGAAFELQSPSWTYKKLYDFCQSRRCADGRQPEGELVFDAAGNLFGTTLIGGPAHNGCCGTLYKLAPQGSGWTQSIAYSFCSQRNCRDGSEPTGPLVMDASGALIGTTVTGGGNNIDANHEGGGTVYRFDGTSLQTLYSFCAQANCADGEGPRGGVSADQAGDLFGTTIVGGKFDEGVVFELSP